MIITCKQQIPRRWIAFTILPWASFSFNFAVVGAAFIFSLKKFVENPAGLTFILSLPGFLAIVAAPTSSFLSDRIWTRYGRRKPFVVSATTGMILALVLMPIAPNVWALIAAYILYHLCDGLSAPRDPLKQEIVPPHERGRATGAMTWCQNLATVIFYSIMLGRFDDFQYLAGFPLHGEAVIYWSAALLLGAMLMLIVLGIKEVDQKSPLRGQRLSFRNIAGGLLDRELWPVYLLVVSFGLLNFFSGFGPFLSTLLYTDQWGYTKQQMGMNVAIGGTINVFIIGLLTMVADRLPRMRAFQTIIALSLAWNVFYYCYVYFVLPDHRPSLIEIILFGEVLSILSILLGLVYYPLIYDYVRRNKMGTFAAGMQIATRGVHLITLNGVGLFVWAYASLFLPPAGEMTHVVLRESTNQDAITNLLQQRLDSTPGAPSSKTVLTLPWQADGIIPENARAWEIRAQNKESEALANEKKKLEQQRSPLLAEAKRMRDISAAKNARAEFDGAKEAEEVATKLETEAAAIAPRVVAIEAELKRRAQALRETVANVLHDKIIAEEERLMAARLAPALLVELSTSTRPESRDLERLLEPLRISNPSVIDLRPLKRDRGYGIGVSVINEGSTAPATLAQKIRSELLALATRESSDLFLNTGNLLTTREVQALELQFETVEQPVVSYVSPVTKVVNSLLRLFDREQKPNHRLETIAQSLRVAEETNHVRVASGDIERSLAVTALLEPQASQARTLEEPFGQKLRRELGRGNSNDILILQARHFSDRIEKAAAAQRITLIQPILTSSYAPLKYDYMSGYLWVFFVGIIGIGLTFVFSRMEARGLIQKRGIQEANG